MSRLLLFLALLPWHGFSLRAQMDTVYLTNPSFEFNYIDFSKDTLDWVDCGFLSETPPDFQPGRREVNEAPRHLQHYLSMVVRDNYTWDAIGQKLRKPLQAGKCYSFKLHLSHARRYIGPGRVAGGNVKYKNPLRLLMWGGSGFCKTRQLLASTDLVKNQEWQSYELHFQPDFDVDYITFQAYFINPLSEAYNGNVLIDHASAMIEVDCREYETVLEDEHLYRLSPRSLQELESFIIHHGKHVEFAQGEPHLRPFKETSLPKRNVLSTAYLAVIGKAMHWFPDKRLVVAVKEKPAALTTARIRYLHRFFKDLRLDAGQYRIMYFAKKDKENAWTAANKYLAIKLEDKH